MDDLELIKKGRAYKRYKEPSYQSYTALCYILSSVCDKEESFKAYVTSGLLQQLLKTFIWKGLESDEDQHDIISENIKLLWNEMWYKMASTASTVSTSANPNFKEWLSIFKFPAITEDDQLWLYMIHKMDTKWKDVAVPFDFKITIQQISNFEQLMDLLEILPFMLGQHSIYSEMAVLMIECLRSDKNGMNVLVEIQKMVHLALNRYSENELWRNIYRVARTQSYALTRWIEDRVLSWDIRDQFFACLDRIWLLMINDTLNLDQRIDIKDLLSKTYESPDDNRWICSTRTEIVNTCDNFVLFVGFCSTRSTSTDPRDVVMAKIMSKFKELFWPRQECNLLDIYEGLFASETIIDLSPFLQHQYERPAVEILTPIVECWPLIVDRCSSMLQKNTIRQLFDLLWGMMRLVGYSKDVQTDAKAYSHCLFLTSVFKKNNTDALFFNVIQSFHHQLFKKWENEVDEQDKARMPNYKCVLDSLEC
jgi:hypothetical protein